MWLNWGNKDPMRSKDNSYNDAWSKSWLVITETCIRSVDHVYVDTYHIFAKFIRKKWGTNGGKKWSWWIDNIYSLKNYTSVKNYISQEVDRSSGSMLQFEETSKCWLEKVPIDLVNVYTSLKIKFISKGKGGINGRRIRMNMRKRKRRTKVLFVLKLVMHHVEKWNRKLV